MKKILFGLLTGTGLGIGGTLYILLGLILNHKPLSDAVRDITAEAVTKTACKFLDIPEPQAVRRVPYSRRYGAFNDTHSSGMGID